MAEKGFGVKEINLIGASGTPTIESPNNLNLNAVNVAISTNVSIGGTLTVSGNISVGGTLTYEDVTNIDSIGIITARDGIKIPDDKHLRFGTDNDTSIVHSGTNTTMNVNGNYFFQGNTFYVQNQAGTKNYIRVYPLTDGRVEIYNDNNKKFETTQTGVVITGIATATTFSGSGASLTSLPAANLTGTVADARISTLTASKLTGALPAISGANLTNLPADTPTNTDIQVVYTVTANGSSAYRFGGNGIVSTEDNPDVYLIRGLKYRFINNSGGSHPFQIRQSSGGSAYSAGVTNNGAASGNIDFQVPYSAPSRLYYQCTAHGGMVGNLYIRGAGGNNTNVGVTTFSGGITVSGNASFAGNNVTMTASGSPNSLNVAGTSRFEIASIENAEIDGEIAHSGDTDTKISFDTNTIKFDTAGSERLRIKNTGEVGINVTPDTGVLLHIKDTDADTVLKLESESGYDARLKLDTSSGSGAEARIDFEEDANTRGFISYTNNSGGTTDDMVFGTAGSERFRIVSDGRISIGSFSDSSARLGVNASSTVELSDSSGLYNQTNPAFLQIKNSSDGITDPECGIVLQPRNSGNGAVALYAKRTGTYTSDLIYRTRTGANTSAERFRITDSGRVGILESNPQSPLQVKGGIRSAQTPGNGHIDLKHDGTNGSLVSTYGSFLLYSQTGDFILHTTGSNTERLRIRGSDGNVMIKTDVQFDTDGSGGIFGKIVRSAAAYTANSNIDIAITQGNYIFSIRSAGVYHYNGIFLVTYYDSADRSDVEVVHGDYQTTASSSIIHNGSNNGTFRLSFNRAFTTLTIRQLKIG